MSNKNNIKGKLKERFNKQNNYNQILNRIETKSEKKKNYLFKYSLIPICLLLIIGILTINNNNNSKSFKKYPKNEIIINELKNKEEISLDLDVRLDLDINVQKEFPKYNFINNIKIPNDMHLSTKYLRYTKRHYETKEELINAPYDVLHDYVLTYESQPTNIGLIEKSITISFSKDFEPLRDYYINDNPLKISTINDIKIKIANYNGIYISTFSYNELNFDIETVGISESEFIKVLKSILK